MAVTVDLTDPATTQHTTPVASWFASAIPQVALVEAAAGRDPALAVADLCRSFRSGSVTVILHPGGIADRVIMAKGIIGTHERFFANTGRGWFVTDHFRNAQSRLPVADRRPGAIGLAEHYLFRAIHGDRTYSTSIDRVTHAEMVDLNLERATFTRTLIDRLFPPADRLERSAAVDQLDGALAKATRVSAADGRVGVLFSGGVDSALLMTYVHPDATPVTWVPDTPEFTVETTYARNAAALIGATIDEAPVREADYRGLLASTTELIGWPCMHYGTPMFAAAYDRPYDAFFMGEGADALFGIGMRLAKVSSWLTNPIAVGLLKRTMDVGPAKMRYRLGQLYDTASRLGVPPGTRSYALGSAGSPTADELGEALGMDAVIAALQTKLDYVDERVELESPLTSNVARNFEYRHWAFTLADPLLVERHQAQGRGKELRNPFGSPEVVETALAVRPRDRYARGLRGKWMVKELLARRLPAYPIDQRKKHTALPFERFYESGPLHNIWDQYDVPAIFTGKTRDAVVRGNRLTWQAISYAVWEARVAQNSSLTAHEAAVTATLP